MILPKLINPTILLNTRNIQQDTLKFNIHSNNSNNNNLLFKDNLFTIIKSKILVQDNHSNSNNWIISILQIIDIRKTFLNL